jgi:hypothetical protein
LQELLKEWIGSYPPVLAGTVIAVALALALITACGRESRGVELEAG